MYRVIIEEKVRRIVIVHAATEKVARVNALEEERVYDEELDVIEGSQTIVSVEKMKESGLTRDRY